MACGRELPTIYRGRRKTVGVVPTPRSRVGPATTAISGRNRTVDMLIVDLALISFIVLVVGLMVIPERRATAATTETASATS